MYAMGIKNKNKKGASLALIDLISIMRVADISEHLLHFNKHVQSSM